MTTAAKPAYRGSLDPFEDIAAQLREMGVCFTLTVQMDGHEHIHAWHNLEDFDDAGCHSVLRATGTIIRNARAIRAKREGGEETNNQGKN